MTTTSQLPGVNVLLMGPGGTGKTFSLKTLIDQGITPMCIFTEQGFEVLGDTPKDKLHWMYVPPTNDSLDSLLERATKAATMTFEAQTKAYDGNRHKNNRFIPMMQACNDFTCNRTGESFGKAASWGTDKALVFDSLSGLTTAVETMIVGTRTAKGPADWGQIQDQVEAFIKWCTNSLRCHFILIAHVEREVDEVAGGSKIMASAPGKKLAPKLPKDFSDVILAQRNGAKFTWSTAAQGADLKARNLPIANDLEPSFKQIIESWKKRGGVIES